MWVFVAAAIFLCIIIFHATTILKFKEDSERFTIGLSVLVIVHGFLGQGAPYEPQSYSSRIVFLVTFVCGLILYTGYSACLTSFLAVKTMDLPFKDFQTFYDKTDFSIVTVKGTYYEDIFKV